MRRRALRRLAGLVAVQQMCGNVGEQVEMNPCELVAVWTQRCSDGGEKADFADYATVAVRLVQVTRSGTAAKGALEVAGAPPRRRRTQYAPAKWHVSRARRARGTGLRTDPHRASLAVANDGRAWRVRRRKALNEGRWRRSSQSRRRSSRTRLPTRCARWTHLGYARLIRWGRVRRTRLMIEGGRRGLGWRIESDACAPCSERRARLRTRYACVDDAGSE